MFSNSEEMADNETDLQIDGKSVYSLRVVDLKQELKKRDITFKTNSTKAQLQSLLIQHLSQTIDSIEDKNEDNSRMTAESEDTNETIESNSEANNVQSIEGNLPKEQTEATDLSQDSGITSSVSFGGGIKLTIKLQPNDSPTKQLSPRSPKKSPTKEMRSPVFVEEVKKVIEEKPKKPIDIIEEEKPIDVIEKQKPIEIIEEKEPNYVTPDISVNKEEDITPKEMTPQTKIEDTVEEKVVEQKVEEKVSLTKESVVEETEQINPDQLLSKAIESIIDNESDKTTDSSSEDSKELPEKSMESPKETKEDSNDTKDVILEKEDPNKTIIEDNIVLTEEVSEDLIEQKTETSVSSNEKEPQKESSIETISEKVDQKRQKSVEKENKSKESEPKEEKVKPPRRRRWGGSVTTDSHQNTRKGISSDQLKELIPDMSSVENTSTPSKVSKSDSIVVTSSLSRTQTTEPNNEMPPKRDIRVVRKSISVTEEEQKSNTEDTIKSTQPIVEQKTKEKVVVETVTESNEESEALREVSPARSPESNIVFIMNLVRPFTLLQLKDILGKTGKLIEERFWIDKIKSKCFATYETVEEALATRLALHGTRWPSSNPKLLSVDFATKEDLDSHLNPELTKDNVLNNKKNDNEVNQKYDIVIRSEEQRTALREKENKGETRPIREWDRDKLVKEDDKRNKRRPISPTTRSRSQEKDIKRRRTGEERVRPADSTSEEAPAVPPAVKRAESPAKLLDDLFRKTTATPSIYWLPLTEEQAVTRLATKEEEEKKRAEERTARDEQFRKRQEERRGFAGPSPPFRNERNQPRMRGSNSPPFQRNFGRRGSPPMRRSPFAGRRSPPRRRSPANRFSRSRSRSPFARRKR